MIADALQVARYEHQVDGAIDGVGLASVHVREQLPEHLIAQQVHLIIAPAHVARQALVQGPEMFLWLLGFFSLQLGILNLLPIPVLDGGHILILFVESAMRRDLSEKVKERVMQACFVFLIAFMGVIVVLDVIKIF